MKKMLATLVLALSIIACGFGQSSDLAPTQTALASTAAAISDLATQAAWTAVPTATPALDFGATAMVPGTYLFSGPGTDYPQLSMISNKVTILGQAYGCSWFKVVSTSITADIGWVSADKLSYNIACADVQPANFPPVPQPTATDTPLPTVAPTPTATKKAASPGVPGNGPVNCQINSNIIIQNRSGSPFTIYLTGPATFTFSIGSGEYTTVQVCSGTYNYTVYGTCNGSAATGTGRISDGDQVYFQCN